MKKVGVSVLSVKDPRKAIYLLNDSVTDYLHIDVMNKDFVEKNNDPYYFLYNNQDKIHKPLDVHLMCNKPYKYILNYVNLNTYCIYIHLEIEENILDLLDLIRSYHIKAGIVVSPDTNLNLLEPYLDYVDIVLVMSVYPGKGGQMFIPNTINRINQLKGMIGNRDILINVDGGINNITTKTFDSDIVVSGSYIMSDMNLDNINKRIDSLR